MKEIDYKSLDILYKFCVNKIDYETFLELMLKIYPGSKGYIFNLWNKFYNDPIGFIISREEKKMLELIQNEINDKRYKG